MSYEKPHNYTSKELLEAEIEDLEIDLSCAKRDGLDEYTQAVEMVLKSKKKELEKYESSD